MLNRLKKYNTQLLIVNINVKNIMYSMNLLKKYLIVSVLFLLSFTIKAQVVYGVKGGLNLANISGGGGAKNYPTFHFGGIVNFEINELLSIQPEFLLTGKGCKYSYTSMVNGSSIKGISNPYYFEIPILVKFGSGDLFTGEKVSTGDFNSIRIYGAIGPYFGVGLAQYTQASVDGVDIINEFSVWDDSNQKRMDMGLTLNVGIEMYHMVLSTYYDIGLNNIVTGKSSRSSNNRVVGFSVGFLFE
jgi:hypothetical protein